jgi:hypothetical protein
MLPRSDPDLGATGALPGHSLEKSNTPRRSPLSRFEAWVIYTRLTQGLPARVEDPTVLIADLICHQQANHDGEEVNDA